MSGASITVGGDCSLGGQAGASLNLRATAAWSLNVNGNATAEYCDVSYCDASEGTTVLAQNSTNSGDNQGWSFAVGGPYQITDGQLFMATTAVGENQAASAQIFTATATVGENEMASGQTFTPTAIAGEIGA